MTSFRNINSANPDVKRISTANKEGKAVENKDEPIE